MTATAIPTVGRLISTWAYRAHDLDRVLTAGDVVYAAEQTDFNRAPYARTVVVLSATPFRTNMSHEVRTAGELGCTCGIDRSAIGMVRVTRVVWTDDCDVRYRIAAVTA